MTSIGERVIIDTPDTTPDDDKVDQPTRLELVDGTIDGPLAESSALDMLSKARFGMSFGGSSNFGYREPYPQQIGPPANSYPTKPFSADRAQSK